ncbi:MAG: histidine phosphatase family protein [Planctomycetes bacterium]|nr:histidine phosphatase family protein [Planctomycetota bacterium]
MIEEPTDFCRLWLFRHPELDPAHAACAVGAGPAELSRRGRAQVLRWLDRLKPVTIAAVYASSQPQCLGPARALAEGRGQEARADDRLRDQEMGRWQGRAWQDVMRDEDSAVRTFFAEFGEAKAPGGESLGEAVERVLSWWTETMPAVAGRSLAVVLPGSLLSGFTAAMLGMRLSRCFSLQLPHGGLGVLDVFQNGARITAWNPDALAAE